MNEEPPRKFNRRARAAISMAVAPASGGHMLLNKSSSKAINSGNNHNKNSSLSTFDRSTVNKNND